MTQTDYSGRINFRFLRIGTIITVLLIVTFLSACSSIPTATPLPTLTPTPARPINPSTNRNVEALNAVQASLGEIEFGFAPLLLQDETRVVLETKSRGQVARLAYPLQPADPADWPAGDSFVLAYAVRKALLDFPQVRRVALGNFELSAPLANLGDRIDHVAVWVTFSDYTQAIIDLSPLATNFAPQHTALKLVSTPATIEEQFAAWREGVFLNQLQPMKVISQNNESYYLLAQVLVFHDHYEFLLRVHPIQTADPMTPLRLMQGTLVSFEVSREGFEEIQEYIVAEGEVVFEKKPELLTRQGDDNPGLNEVLDDHLQLLWHLVVKFEHEPPDPDLRPSPTPTATSTPTPTPTPTPTATPTPEQAIPLEIS